MPAIVVLGAQWGDEGKGKATDLLGSSIDYCVRYQGGNNAGHTIVVNGEKFATHLLPQRRADPRLHPGHRQRRRDGRPGAVRARSTASRPAGWTPRRLVLSANAHLITTYHTAIDKVTERFLGKNQIGTTGRGIGPAYADKINRIGIRVADVFDEKILQPEGRGRPRGQEPPAGQGLQPPRDHRRGDPRGDRGSTPTGSSRWSPTPPWCSTGRSTTARPCSSRARRRPCSTSTTAPIRSSRRSNPIAGGVGAGAGIGPKRIDRIIGVIKAYTTRVGSGPFPTELLDDDGDQLREIGAEFGTTTGRPRRCGWYDAVIARYAARHQRAHRVLPDQARRASAPGTRSRSAWPTRSTASGTTRCR